MENEKENISTSTEEVKEKTEVEEDNASNGKNILNEDSDVKLESLSDVSDDEDNIQKAMQSNGFVLFFKRNAIKIKNHISIFPMLFTIISLLILMLNLPTFITACSALWHDSFNAFFLFCNVLLSLLIVLLYMNCHNKKTKKKKYIVCYVLFVIMLTLSIIIDVRFIRDATIETVSLYNSINKIKDTSGNIAKAISLSYSHIIFLGITLVLSILAPVLQPFTKKIHI